MLAAVQRQRSLELAHSQVDVLHSLGALTEVRQLKQRAAPASERLHEADKANRNRR